MKTSLVLCSAVSLQWLYIYVCMFVQYMLLAHSFDIVMFDTLFQDFRVIFAQVKRHLT